MRTIKVAVFDYYPMVNSKCKLPTWRVSKLCDAPGLAVELIKLQTDYLNWTIEADVKSWDDYDDERSLDNGTYDMYALTYEKTDVREGYFDFSTGLYESSSRLVVKRAENSLTSIFDFFAVYNWKTWLLMGAALFFFIIIGALTRYVEYRLSLRKTPRLTDVAWRMLRLQLIQYQKIDYRLMAGSFSLLVFAFLQVTIIISLYQSWIISSVVRTRTFFPFNVDDLPTLLKEGRYKFVSDDVNEWYLEDIRAKSESPFFELRNSMHNDSLKLVEDEETVLHTVNQGAAIAVEQDDTSLSYLVLNWCELVRMPSPFNKREKFFMFRKNSPIRADIDRAIQISTDACRKDSPQICKLQEAISMSDPY
ncbi:PBPb domain-containing protein [Aphelenchoides bicaudatus]|nr:PBPb domain-containing protein [Aphelenchoides bicaudatus]